MTRLLGPSFAAVGSGNIAAYLAVALIITLEWSAGGRTTPYHYLLMLPILFVAATGTRRQMLAFAGALSIAIWVPLLYQDFSRRLILDIATQLLMTLAIGAIVWVLFMLLRAARGTIDEQRVAAETMAREDSLTGLGNRRAFHEALAREIARAQRANEPLSLLIGDLDGFKLVNDTEGHAAGDEALRGVADALRSSGRGADECFRWGGDEFAILLPDADFRQAAEVAGRMQRAVAAWRARPSGASLGITFGVAQLERGADPEALIATADRDLLARKRMALPAV